ncbi:MAG: hypothetical protein Q8N56_03050, partial [bacterium]|nr:hypothetical protein [bacterium]
TDRTDIVIPEDVIEEVIRINGYEKIPQNQIPAFKAAEDITPRIILLADRTRDILVFLGFDEVLSWPLTKKEINSAVRWQTRESIPAQNSVNEEFPDLRESIASGLLSQLKEYEKKNVGEINIFEIGRIFGKEKERYAEYDNLGLLIKSKNGRSIKELKAAIEKLLRSLGFSAIIYSQSVIKPRTANPISCWDIFVGGKLAGIIYKLKSSESKETAFAELRLSELSEISNKSRINPAAELEQKLVVLDANIELEKDASVSAYLASMENKIGEKNLWAAEISDRFPIGQKTRYTIRVTYKGLSDKEAKALHTRIFNKQ